MKKLTREFIEPGVDFTLGHTEGEEYLTMPAKQIVGRWATDKGKKITDGLIKGEFKRDVIESLIGKVNGKIDLRGFDFCGKDVSGKDFSKCDFYKANFENTKCSSCDFSESYLSEANIKGANFEWCKMPNVFLDGVDYNQTTNFNGVDLSSINFTLAILLRDLAVSQQRIAHLKKRNPVLAKILYITTDYGRSLLRWLLWCIAVILFFAVGYWFFNLTQFPQQSLEQPTLFTNLYYSIVTFSTVGYGDVLPRPGFGQLLAMVEICIGYLMGGLLIAILTKKVIGN